MPLSWSALARSCALFLIPLVMAGCITSPAAEQDWRYLCEDGYEFTITYNRDRDAVRFRDGDLDLELELIESASGSRYTDGSFVFWSKGLSSFLRRDGDTLHTDCIGDYDI